MNDQKTASDQAFELIMEIIKAQKIPPISAADPKVFATQQAEYIKTLHEKLTEYFKTQPKA